MQHLDLPAQPERIICSEDVAEDAINKPDQTRADGKRRTWTNDIMTHSHEGEMRISTKYPHTTPETTSWNSANTWLIQVPTYSNILQNCKWAGRQKTKRCIEPIAYNFFSQSDEDSQSPRAGEDEDTMPVWRKLPKGP